MLGLSKVRRLRIVLCSVALALGAGATAWAAVPDDNGEIHGCYLKVTGVLRVIDTAKDQKCSPTFETPLTWNQRGEQGAQGPKGDAGEAATVYTNEGHQFLSGANYQVVTTLELPAGRYLLSGKGQALNQREFADVVSCNVYESGVGHLDGSTVNLPSPSSYGTLLIERAIELSEPRTIRVECIGGRGLETVGVFVRLTATTVGAIIEQ